MRLLTFILLLSPIVMLAQTNTNNSFKVRKYSSEQPSFPGGADEMNQFINRFASADFNAIVELKFRVCKNGNIKKIKVIKGVNKVVDRKAIKIVKKMPKWEPARLKGKPINANFELKIDFTKTYN